MYGEKVDIYSGNDPSQKEFLEAGLDYLRNMNIALDLPLYRIYPTKAFRKYKEIVKRLHEAGEFHVFIISFLTGTCIINYTGKQILNRRYEEIKDAISSGTVDETKAVGKLVFLDYGMHKICTIIKYLKL